jgi:NADH-quinone oxidoreductase subunit H
MTLDQQLDQLFVTLKHWVLGLLPETFQSLASILLSIGPLIGVFAGLFAITTVIERKALGRIQNRLGPNRVGPFGFLQFAADGLKTLIKEDIVPHAADKVVHYLAPLALVVPVMLAYSVLPVGRNMVGIDLDAGVLFVFAVGAGTEIAVFMAGWSGRNKYSLLGAMRAIAQMISYELPLILAAVPAIMIVGSLSTVKLVEAQGLGGHWLASWHVFTPWGLAGFILFMIAATAESNRSPFDLPEGESEIIAGYYLEYSGFKFALFFLGEYLGMFAICGLGITLYLGGWNPPCATLAWIPSWAWFFLKLGALVMLLIWVRGTLPRLRMDQLMNFAWKFMLPMTLLNIVATALWHYIGGGLVGWLGGALLLGGAFWGLGGTLAHRQYQRRTYRYAE